MTKVALTTEEVQLAIGEYLQEHRYNNAEIELGQLTARVNRRNREIIIIVDVVVSDE